MEASPVELNETLPELTFEKFYAPSIERGAALSVAADLDAAVGVAFTKMLIADKISQQVLSPQGELGTFGSRVRLLFALGIIKDVTYLELIKLSKIRNAFAHSPDVESFKHPKIQGLASAIIAVSDMKKLKSYYDYAYPISMNLTMAVTKLGGGSEEFVSDGPVRTSTFLWQSIIEHMIKQGYDIKQPRWAFCYETAVFYSCFKRAAERDDLMSLRPWF